MAIDDAIDEMDVPGKVDQGKKDLVVVNKSLQDMKYATDWQSYILFDYLERIKKFSDSMSFDKISGLVKFDHLINPHLYINVFDFIEYTKSQKYDHLWKVLSATLTDQEDLAQYIDFYEGEDPGKITSNSVIDEILCNNLNSKTLRNIETNEFYIPFLFAGLLIEHGKDFINMYKFMEKGFPENIDRFVLLSGSKMKVNPTIEQLTKQEADFLIPFADYIQNNGAEVTKVIKELDELDKSFESYNDKDASNQSLMVGMRQEIFKRLAKYNPNLIYRGKK